MTLPTIVSFWHGPISWLERLSITSFRRRGHPVTVYSYAPIADLPEGAAWRDAAEVLPQSELVFYKGKGTPAVFSDRFRLELLKRRAGVYSDLDVYCVRPITVSGPYLMAYENERSINNAVLYVDAEAPLLADLLSVFDTARQPLWLPYLTPVRRAEVALRRLLGENLPVENMQFGASGPMPLTFFVARRGLQDHVLPAAAFYPVKYADIPGLMRTGSSLDHAMTEATVAIHLWRSQLTDRGRAGLLVPELGSALAELCASEGIDPTA